jgi:flagellar biosynthesis protein FlhG
MSDQAETLRRIGKGGNLISLPKTRSRVLALSGGKGGVGKSTMAVNLAVAYAGRGARVLTLDGDLGMADLNLLLGVAPAKSMLDVLEGCPVNDVLVPVHGIQLLPALNGSSQLANLDASARARLSAAIETLSERFDTLVMDTGAGIGDTAMSIAASAMDVVVVVTPEPLSLADAYACLKVLSQRQGVKRAFVLPNAIRSPSEAEEAVGRLQALVDRFLGITIVPLPAVPHDPAIRVAAGAGVPLLLHSPDSPAARAINKVARRIDALTESDESSDSLRIALRQSFGDQGKGKGVVR